MRRSPLLLENASVPEHMPGEPPDRSGAAAFRFARLVLRVFLTALVILLTAGLWPLYLVGVAVYGWAPHVPTLRQAVRYLRAIWTVRPPAPGLGVLTRAWHTLTVVRMCAMAPVWGLAWFLDEVLYGEQLRATPLVEPLIEISAARSGSTQLARYLESDPSLAAPPLLQFMFPYLWLWRLVPGTLGRFISKDRVRAQFEAMMPLEFRQRHEADPFLTDTFDVMFLGTHLNHLSLGIAPALAVRDFSFGAVAPENRELWDHNFVELLDRVGRKTLLYAGPAPDGGLKRFFVKGHFLAAADALERRYPDARFLTMIREPAPRLQSGINFLRASPLGAAFVSVPWIWLAEALSQSEATYCELEQEWFNRKDGARRCVLRFSDYVRDLEGAMTQVYRECLDTDELPAHVPRVHEPRDRTNYLLDRSLAEVGVDEDALNARLAGYIAWCRGEESRDAASGS